MQNWVKCPTIMSTPENGKMGYTDSFALSGLQPLALYLG